MFIQNIKMSGFKNVPETETRQFEFFDFTKIQGENFVGKTTIGDALSWVFTGRSSTGITADYILRNDESRTAVVEVAFTDNGGKTHLLRREMHGSNHVIYLDDIPVKEEELMTFIGSPELFLSTFMIGYFHRLVSKVAKELLMGVIPFPSHVNIMNKVEDELRPYLPENEEFDSNVFLKQKRSELKMVEDEIKRFQGMQSLAEEKIKGIKLGDLIDESEIKRKLDSLEERKVNLIKLSAQSVSIGYLEDKLLSVRQEIKNLKNQKGAFQGQQQKFCPTCKQPVPEEELQRIMEKARSLENDILNHIQRLENEEKDLLQRIDAAREKHNESKAIQEELSLIEQEIKQLRATYEEVLLHNQVINSNARFLQESRNMLDTTREQMDKLCAGRYKINRAITAVSQYNVIKADLQYESVRRSLKNVSIRLQRLNQSTNELRDCFEILYKGREYSQISTSETIRAGLEISAFINKRTGLKLPVFIDNAESITHYEKPDTQVFEAKVMKDAPLTVTDGTKVLY
ncbi:MAG TPA: hypothetical protein VEG39_00580 [Clostridia bacterium]|nr:hypothetical protein [Clostridia bacterium]